MTQTPPILSQSEKDAALFVAVLQGDLSFVKQLLTDHANPNARDSHDRTPLFDATLHQQTDIMLALIHAGADVNAVSRSHHVPLEYAISPAYRTQAQLLLAAGADMEYQYLARPKLYELTPSPTLVPITRTQGRFPTGDSVINYQPLPQADDASQNYLAAIKAGTEPFPKAEQLLAESGVALNLAVLTTRPVGQPAAIAADGLTYQDRVAPEKGPHIIP